MLHHDAGPERLPEMADQLWLANPLHRLLVHATMAAANSGLTIWREAAEIWISTARVLGKMGTL
jgi:hypothetical protein